MKIVSTKSTFWKIATFFVSLVALLAIGFSLYTYTTLKKIQNPAYQQILIEKETNKLLSEVGEFFLLPEGTPQIAIVSDPEALKKWQPFFEKAITGDRIIVYPSQVLLYRPNTKQLINVWPVSSVLPGQPLSPPIQ